MDEAMNKELAAIIARKIFEIGGMHETDQVQRIQFLGGTYPHAERPMGGFGERPLAHFIEKVLREHRSSRAQNEPE
jgi:hypothetical protein